jgi:hypothetical protein
MFMMVLSSTIMSCALTSRTKSVLRPGTSPRSWSGAAAGSSPTSPRAGGRHVYVLFAAPLPWLELRDLARAISLRYPAVDPAPVASLGGQVSPPGAGRGGKRSMARPSRAVRAAI